ncbi:MAG: hypothetical protein ABL926_14320 [Novosphingobium sp.]
MRSALLSLVIVATGCDAAPTSAVEAPTTPTAPVAAAAPATPPAKAVRPDLSVCPKVKRDNEEGLLERTAPLPVPAAFAPMVASDMNHFAVTTLAGHTGCVDVRWMEAVEGMALSKDQRFLSFGWSGYEAFGHIVVDRADGANAFETGDVPVWSRTGKRFAAIDVSESGFGGLNGFGVWEAGSAGITQLVIHTDGLPPGDWRMGAWSGDSCVNLSLVPSERIPSDANALARTPRDPWFASADRTWKPQAGTCPKA